nr:T-complex protein 1 subunit gamma [Tanacetum cinerariifolium]
MVTNGWNAILRGLDIAHPAAKVTLVLLFCLLFSINDRAKSPQDEKVSDGTTSIIVLAGEMLHVAVLWIWFEIGIDFDEVLVVDFRTAGCGWDLEHLRNLI